MPDIKLWTPRVEATLDDGSLLVVQVLNADLLNWDRTAARHGWPDMKSAPFLWLTFITWTALRRTGQLDRDLSWEAFSSTRCVAVRNLTESEGTGAADVADPTLAVVEPG